MTINYTVFGLERSQSPRGRVGKLPDPPSEITEVGAAKLDGNLETISEFSRFVRPFIHKKPDYHIRALIDTQTGQLQKEGKAFAQVIREFFHWCGMDNGEEVIFRSWGNMGLLELQRNLHFSHIQNPFSCPLFYYDVQRLYGRYFSSAEKKATALTTAVETLGLKGEGAFHRATKDAHYVVKVLQQLPFKALKVYRSLDYYHLPANENEGFYIDFPNYAEYVSRIFSDRDSAIHDKTITGMLCYRCHRILKKELCWFSANQRSCYCIVAYPEHGLLRRKLKIRRAEGMQVYCIETTKFVSQETAERIAQPRQTLREKQNLKNHKLPHRRNP